MCGFYGMSRFESWLWSSGTGNVLEMIPTLSIVMPWVAGIFIFYELSGRGRASTWRSDFINTEDFSVPDEVFS
ncbi:hypothetical protein GCM10009069_22500 [Algimonas arctica]|uniref:Uncharacterized protein n=1 Tax=Algimonas arctica TaxID=1479486 RepID=A0A8J3CS52_9PROT|nr:hypothetical protein GCM10009069_22500 [Algimonas arctica]